MPKQLSRDEPERTFTPETLSRTAQDVNLSSSRSSSATFVRAIFEDAILFEMCIAVDVGMQLEALFDAIRLASESASIESAVAKLMHIERLAQVGKYIASDESNRIDCAQEKIRDEHLPALLAFIEAEAS